MTAGWCLLSGMDEEGWRNRLAKAVSASDKSLREISRTAGMGDGYLQDLLKGNKDPGVSSLTALCEAIPVSLSYVLVGVQVTPEEEELIRLLSRLPDGRRKTILALARDLAGLPQLESS